MNAEAKQIIAQVIEAQWKIVEAAESALSTYDAGRSLLGQNRIIECNGMFVGSREDGEELALARFSDASWWSPKSAEAIASKFRETFPGQTFTVMHYPDAAAKALELANDVLEPMTAFGRCK